jgi:hypothetical protein
MTALRDTLRTTRGLDATPQLLLRMARAGHRALAAPPVGGVGVMSAV